MKRSQVDALMALGLSELDAWQCVHRISGDTRDGRGPDAFVLVQVEHTDAPPAPNPFMGIPARQIAAVAAHGAAWRQVGPGQWQYLRRIEWSVEQLVQLESEIHQLFLKREPQ
ncbi:hypothetical protein HLB44_36330 [Aquincola sp. S2]|uniref:Uncharacterized protein n=1 Tax=Pseudaquabacterium terrae TaxID=2732868 RepID=A0ABX2EVF5_9BURK|nr:hypothetical protein [Aquabacterium terrae]NRF72431.1 hypothetical protein [Aquabacterium terrae]